MKNSKEKKAFFLITLARALIVLKKNSIRDISLEIGVPGQNIKAFLCGAEVALSPNHASKFFYYLGIGRNISKKTGFLSNCVHPFTLDWNKNTRERAQSLVSTILPLLPGHKAMALPVRSKRSAAVFLKTNTAKVVININVGFWDDKPTLAQLGLTRGGVAYPGRRLPLHYEHLILNGQLGLVDFDAVFVNRYPRWDMIRKIANSHGIPYSDIIEFLKAESERRRREPFGRRFEMIKGSGRGWASIEENKKRATG